MTKSSNNIESNSNNQNHPQIIDAEIVKIMSKILNVSEKDILESKKLFLNISSDMKTCLYKLSEMKEDDYVNAYMSLEYILATGKSLDGIAT